MRLTTTNPSSWFKFGLKIVTGLFLLFLPFVPSTSVSQSLTEVGHLGEDNGAVAVDGTTAVFNQGTQVRCLDLMDPSHPIIGGTVDVGAVPISLTLIGNLAYGVAEFGQFFVIDVSNPFDPSFLGGTDWQDMKRALWVRPEEDFAYVTGCKGVHVIDIADPSSPSLLTTVPKPTCPSSIEGDNEYLYVVNAQGPNLLSIYSLSNPASPTLMGEGPARTLETGGTYNSLELSEHYAYLGHVNGIGIVDIASVTEPVLVKTFDAARRILSLDGNKLVADSWGNVTIWDISDRENPSLEHFTTSFDQGDTFQSAILDGKALRAQSHALYITDIGSGTATKLWSVSPYFGSVHGLARKGHFLFTGTYPGIASIDASEPGAPRVIQRIVDRLTFRCGILNDYLYALSNEGFITVWDVSNPFNMTKLPTEYPLAGGGLGARMDIVPNRVAVSASETFHLFDHESDGSLTEVSRFKPVGGIDAVALNGDIAYMARLDGTLLVYDISNPASPTYVAAMPVLTSLFPNGLGAVLEVEDTRLHMFVARAGYALLDVSNPRSPSILGTFSNSELEAFGLAVDESNVYLGTDGFFGHQGIRVLDISTPSNIVQVESVDATFRTRDLLIYEEFLFSAETRGGLRVRSLYNDSPDPTSTPTVTATFTVPPTSTPYPTNTFYPTNTPYPTHTFAPTCEPVITNATGDVTGDGEVGPDDLLELVRFWKTLPK